MSSSASLSFDPVQITAKQGVPFEVVLNIFTDTQPAISTDIFVTYDPLVLKPKLPLHSTNALFQQTDAKIVSPGRLYVFGIRIDKSQSAPANGSLATVTFEPLTTGRTELSFDCVPGSRTTSQIIKNAPTLENIINCDRTKSHTAQVLIEKGGVLGSSSYMLSQNTLLLATIVCVTLAITAMLYMRFRKLQQSIHS